ncbi:hypothetical protein BDF14DRAFT_1886262 [Spinellus fusiger]|nr:hypothetical protein BDF14DRAFT_1886262 [Spinellus fusiger]
MVSILLSVVMVVGPVVGYIDQYVMIQRKKSSIGFNPATCGILLFSRLGKRFDITLLIQSIVMLFFQLILLQAVVKYKYGPTPTPRALYSDIGSYLSSSSLDDQLEAEAEGGRKGLWKFWAWDRYRDYLYCLIVLTAVVGVLFFFLREKYVFVEILGMVSLGIESTLPLPQCWDNFRRRSTAGFSLLVLGSWFLGDGYKVFYFVTTLAPIQFTLCGIIQLCVDSLIVLQFIIFSDRVKKWFGFSPWLDEEDQQAAALLRDDTDSF